MGNSESQYSIQGPKSTGLILTGKPKLYPLKYRSTKDEVLSAHAWWKGVPGSSRYKARVVGRGCLSPPQRRGEPYVSKHYDHLTTGVRGSPHCRRLHGSPAGGLSHLLAENVCCPYEGGGSPYRRASGEVTGRTANGHRTPERTRGEGEEALEEQSSPRVVIKKDGSLRVEFTNANSGVLLDESSGPVKLLKFSPARETDLNPSSSRRRDARCKAPPPSSTARTSKGSSLSSEGSWYDSPWGPSAEFSDQDQSCSSGRNRTNGLAEQLEVLGQQSPPVSVSDLYRDPNMSVTFPMAKDPPTQCSESSNRIQHRASFVDIPAEDECQEARQYSSFTLPCRKAKPAGEESALRKGPGSVRSRMRRLSDWTGSLSRKKRKTPGATYKESSEAFDSGVDGLAADAGSSSQVSGPWYQGRPVSVGASRAQSAGALHHSNDALRQNIYENFMRELETETGPGSGGGGSGERRDPSTGTEEDGESSSESTGGSLEQLDLLFEKEQGVVRRAGWLSFKPLLTLQKDRKLELVTRRKWKQYWVTLKGCTLLFYETYGGEASEQELSPRYALFAEDSVVQAVPEHPKKENVFCLSNIYGDVYLFQANNQTDLENWVTAIHSASASLFAKRHGKEDTVRLLRSQIRGLLQKIDMDGKMKKMAELQLSIVGDPKNRKAIENQIQQWEQNLEKFNMDLFRMRCYLASLQGDELPNPKSLLAAACRPSKSALGRLGIFSVSSFHSLICSRDDTTMRRRSMALVQRSCNKRGLFSSLKGLDNLTRRGRDKRPSTGQIFESDEGGKPYCLPATGSEVKQPEPILRELHTSQIVEVPSSAPGEQLHNVYCDDVFPQNVFTLNMARTTCTGDFGFAVTGHINRLKRSCIFVSEVLADGLAFSEGLRPGDEILVLNGVGVSTLDLGLIQTLFAEESLQLTIRRDAPPTSPVTSDPLTLSPLLSQSQLLQNFLDTHHRAKSTTDVSTVPEVPDDSLDLGNGLQHNSHRAVKHSKSVDTVCTLYHTFQEGSGGLMEGQKAPPSPGANPILVRPCPRHMSPTERLRKVIQELVDTEKSYVKDLSCLFEIYLKPLQNETFLTLDEMDSLFGSLPEMLDFQRVFLQTLEERIASSPDFSMLETPLQFKKLLFSLGRSFLYYADHFKLYSGFCANHIKVQKVLERAKTDRAFKEFLDARNPTNQHSSTLESYLIKPVQRVLKYPLLLRELVSLTDTDSEEHYHLTEALKAMEKVASHINEMQKIYEDYGSVFDQLVAEQSSLAKEVTELSMGEFLMHSSVVWLNPHPSLGRMRREPELTVFVFKKAVILVYREFNKLKKKMTAPRSAHSHGPPDPFKFRWLIPLSALQVRLGTATGSETNFIWELIHTKSEREGRPETVFQLCSSAPESKVPLIKVIRSILRDNARRNMLPTDRTSKEHLTPLRRTLPSSARIGSSRASWLCKKSQLALPTPSDTLKPGHPDSDEGSLSSQTQSSSAAPAGTDPIRPKTPPAQQALSCGSRGGKRPSGSSSVKESDILSDEDDGEFSEAGGRAEEQGGPPRSAIEAQFARLRLTEEAVSSLSPAPRVQPEGAEVDTPESLPKVGPGHYCNGKRKPCRVRRRSRSLDSQTDLAAVDLNALLERDFSIHSLTSVVNEDCFYSVTDTSSAPSSAPGQ
ncbi:hypothetical protein DPEC_G00313850 [Dallia pectoralis]|uniref:Uncharacterized protein n=1 Tax=Dallia pectoralis TaxID=75939 RepID=A0ACC2FC12_DALPE|nr:hypothetical protein DPEC_G00313850 [Dallia pectoralis]